MVGSALIPIFVHEQAFDVCSAQVLSVSSACPQISVGRFLSVEFPNAALFRGLESHVMPTTYELATRRDIESVHLAAYLSRKVKMSTVTNVRMTTLHFLLHVPIPGTAMACFCYQSLLVLRLHLLTSTDYHLTDFNTIHHGDILITSSLYARVWRYATITLNVDITVVLAIILAKWRSHCWPLAPCKLLIRSCVDFRHEISEGQGNIAICLGWRLRF
jgi:hypothetical protein